MKADEDDDAFVKAEVPEDRSIDMQMLDNAVREAIATAVEGRSYRSYERQMARNILAGALLSKRLSSRRSGAQLVSLAAMVLKMWAYHEVGAAFKREPY